MPVLEFDLSQTIVAISSGLLAAPRGIVRLSGRETRRILSHLLRHDPAAVVWLDTVRSHPMSTPCRCSVDASGRSIAARLYFWPDHRSFTGEPCAELHLCGSLPILELVVAQAQSGGARLAQRGEFTLRSFLAGKMDLLQAEAVLGVIQSEQQAELELALEQLGGNLSQPVRALRTQLLQLTAHLEAGLDFVEEDIEFISQAELLEGIMEIRERLHSIAAKLQLRGTGNRDLQVVLVGPPNAGKSSLFNALLGEERTIVSPAAGTTRDAISALVKCKTVQFQLTDTAGVEEIADDTPRALAQQMLADRLRSADLLVLCVDSSCHDWRSQLALHRTGLAALGVPVICVGTKRDHLIDGGSLAVTASDAESGLQIGVSIHLPETMESLRQLLADRICELHQHTLAESLQRTALRCLAAIDQACQALDRAMLLIHDQAGEELVATELRYALDDLAAMIGEVHSDTILGEIFSRFCIGK